MDRRRLFSLLPLSALGLAAPIVKAELAPQWDILDELPAGSLWTVYRDGEAIAKSMTVGALRSMKLNADDVISREPPERTEPSPWVERICERQMWEWKEDGTREPVGGPCGTRYQHLRGQLAICPKCNWCMQSPREHVAGIEVK